MGDIYVNDAPLASLSNSTTINDIQNPRRVMGTQMSEDIRNIAQFFMKKFPLDIKSIYYKMPDSNAEFFTVKSSAIIGGLCKSQNDVLEKILLANSFLDTFNKIFFVGEMGLAAVHALGLEVGQVERTEDAGDEYSKLREFFETLFSCAVEKGCEIILPCDFVTCEKEPLEKLIGLNKSGSKEGPDASRNMESKLSGSHANIEGGEDMNKTAEMERHEALGVDHTFTPKHWTDAKLFLG
jgi:hypothetical protein